MRRQSLAVPAALVGALALAAPVFAGPPLLCHPFSIGDAASLPWDGSGGWSQGRAGYDVQHVVADVEALLTPTTPVIVRMETLRRATIYASQDAKTAAALLAHVMDRVRTDQRGRPAGRACVPRCGVCERGHARNIAARPVGRMARAGHDGTSARRRRSRIRARPAEPRAAARRRHAAFCRGAHLRRRSSRGVRNACRQGASRSRRRSAARAQHRSRVVTCVFCVESCQTAAWRIARVTSGRFDASIGRLR